MKHEPAEKRRGCEIQRAHSGQQPWLTIIIVLVVFALMVAGIGLGDVFETHHNASSL